MPQALLLAALCVCAPIRAAPHGAAPADLADRPLPAPAAAGTGELYLEVKVNGRGTGLVMRFTQHPGSASLRAGFDDLRSLGIDPLLAGNVRQEEYDLDGMRGLTYVYDAAAQGIDLRIVDALRPPFVVQTRPLRALAPGSATPGAVFNYDLYTRIGPAAQAAALTEVRLFNDSGVFSSTALALVRGQSRSLLRFDTSWSYADPATLTSVQVGDFISRSLPWSRSIRMGGVEWRKNFDLRPDVLTYPVPQIGGSAVVPSSVALYVNQMQQYAGAVPDGPFVLNQVAGLNGAGQATLITRDAVGREVATSIALYIDTRMLAPGFDDMALGAGMVRRSYGVRSFAYAPQPALTGSMRRGLSDFFTLEGHAEASTRLLNGGAGLLARAGEIGVVNAALAGSVAGRAGGFQATLGYQYLSPRWAIDLQSTRASAAYADLGSLEGTPVARANDRITLHGALSTRQNVTLSYVGLRLGAAPAARIAALAYGLQITPGIGLSVNAYRDLADTRARGVQATLSVALPGRVGATATSGAQGGARARTLALSRAGDVAASPGWSIQQGTQSGASYLQAQVQYVSSTAQYSGAFQHDSASTQGALGMTGSVVAMNGRILPARQTGTAFALVSTGMPDVTVLQENRPIGRTDRHGDLLVPDLVPYTVNRLGIDADELPAEAQVERVTLEVVPQRLAGVVASLKVARYDGVTVKLVDGAGKPVPSGAAVAFGSGDPASIVGYDGIVFVPHAGATNLLTLHWGGDPVAQEGAPGAGGCAARFAYDPATVAAGAMVGPVVCQSPAKGHP